MKNIITKIKNKNLFELFYSFKRFIYCSVSEYKVNLMFKENYFSDSFVFSEMSISDLEEIINENKQELIYQKYLIIHDRIINNSANKPYIVRYENNIAGYYHIAFDDNFDTVANLFISKKGDTIHLFDDYTFEKYRGKGIHGFSVYSRKMVGCKERKKFATVNILDGNLFSEKSYIKLGFVKQRKIFVFFRKFKLIENL